MRVRFSPGTLRDYSCCCEASKRKTALGAAASILARLCVRELLVQSNRDGEPRQFKSNYPEKAGLTQRDCRRGEGINLSRQNRSVRNGLNPLTRGIVKEIGQIGSRPGCQPSTRKRQKWTSVRNAMACIVCAEKQAIKILAACDGQLVSSWARCSPSTSEQALFRGRIASSATRLDVPTGSEVHQNRPLRAAAGRRSDNRQSSR